MKKTIASLLGIAYDGAMSMTANRWSHSALPTRQASPIVMYIPNISSYGSCR